MRFTGERGAARARALVESFRPLRLVARDVPRVVLTGFGAFAGAPRNATEEMIRALASEVGVELHARTFRARDLATGRGLARLPSGLSVQLSLMVLPVVWEAAGALVAKEARATRASLVIMSGVQGRGREITFESVATTARKRVVDVLGVRPPRPTRATRALPTTLDVNVARAAAEAALARESFGDLVSGAIVRELDETNAFVCNDTAHLTARLASKSARVLRSGAAPEGIAIARVGRVAHGFVHWPTALESEHAPGMARVLLATVDSLFSAKRAGAAA